MFTPVYIVQECAPLRVWKKFIMWKKMETLLCNRTIFAVKLEIYLLKLVSCTLFAPLKEENFSALRAKNILHFLIVFCEGYYPKSITKFWKFMEFSYKIEVPEIVNIEVHIIFS